MPVGLPPALVIVQACVALVALGTLASLKDESGNPMGSRGGATGSNAIPGEPGLLLIFWYISSFKRGRWGPRVVE